MDGIDWRRRWEDNIKMDFMEMVWGPRLHPFGGG